MQYQFNIAPLGPNPALKRNANGRPPSPGRWNAVHCHRPGLGVLPSVPLSSNVRSQMSRRTLLALSAAATLATLSAHAQDGGAASESRDAAAGFMGTTNFSIGRIASECLAVVGRPESPQDYVAVWQRRNATYWLAARKYMIKRLDEALASGGAAKRDSVLAAYAAAVRREGEASAQSWITRGSREEACMRAISLIDAGGLDVTRRVPIHDELEALAKWAEE